MATRGPSLRLVALLLLATTAVFALAACTIRYTPDGHPRSVAVTAAPGVHYCLHGKVGVTVNEHLHVIGLARGGPAWQAGIRYGDIVVAVNGRRVFTIADAQFFAAGPPGTLATVTVSRPGESRLRTYSVFRACLP